MDAARCRLEVSMRVDAAHLEAMIATRDRTAFDIQAAMPGGPDEPRLLATVQAAMQARFTPMEAVATGPGRAGDRFDLHWLGAELDGPDCWLHFEWVAPGATDAATDARPVQVRATLLIDPAMQQVNTVSVPGHGAARFAAGRTDWADVGVRLPPRTPGPMRVARAGEAGPRVLLVPGPEGPSDAVTGMARRLRPHARVEVALWPGGDGEAAPPSNAGPGGWADWSAASLRARLHAGAPEPVHLVLVGPDAERLAARADLAKTVAGSGGSILVIEEAAAAPPTAAPPPNPVLQRYRRDLAVPASGAAADVGGRLTGVARVPAGEAATDAVLAAISGSR